MKVLIIDGNTQNVIKHINISKRQTEIKKLKKENEIVGINRNGDIVFYKSRDVDLPF